MGGMMPTPTIDAAVLRLLDGEPLSRDDRFALALLMLRLYRYGRPAGDAPHAWTRDVAKPVE